MKTVNASDKYTKIDLSFQFRGNSKNISVVFERPIEMLWWYRVFRKPTGRYVAIRDMSDAKGGWTFIGSVNLSELFPGMIII